ncbi:hypothetical protein [Streptomyces sp. t39]|nr:hypothetical protein [Streptomyces sp. t39]
MARLLGEVTGTGVRPALRGHAESTAILSGGSIDVKTFRSNDLM